MVITTTTLNTSKGANLYYKNKLPNITGTYIPGELDGEVLREIEN